MKLKNLINYLVITLMALAPNVASASTSTLNVVGTKQVLFSTSEDGSHPYRIPAIATLINGDILAISDYRPCNKDVGNGEVDIYAKVSKDNGASWTPSTRTPGKSGGLKIADGSSSNGYGDAAVVVDSESGDVLVVCVAGNVVYSNGTSSKHNKMAQIRATFNKTTGELNWQAPEDKTSEFFKGDLSGAYTMFMAAGKMVQSTKVKVGTHYRIYGALLVKNKGNYVVYSDNFGESWSILGGACCSSGDEAKVEELPNGDIVLSSRKKGGRYFNVFNFSNLNNATGSWSGGTSGSSYTFKSNCEATNGELLLYKNVTKKDGTICHLLLQSLPTASSRGDVSIFYKEISTDETKQYKNTDFTSGWSSAFQVESGNSAYSTMTILENDEIGFMYEDDYTTSTYGGGGCEIVYVPLKVSEITGGNYVYDASALVETVATPVISPNGGYVYESQAITLSSATEGAKIYYTIDGTEPTENSTLYTGAFTLSTSATVKAIAVKEDCNNSAVASSAFNVLKDGSTLTIQYRFKNVQKNNGTVYYFTYDATNGIGLSTNVNDAALYTRGNGTKSGTYTFQTPDGNYLIFSGRDLSDENNRGYNSGKGFLTSYESEKCDLTVAAMVAGGNVESFTGSYVTITGQRDFTKKGWITSTTTQEQAYFVIKSDGKFDGATEPYFSDSYSSAFVIEEIVTITEPEVKVAAPVFSLPSGTYEKGVELTISCPTEGARIFIAEAGTTPTAESIEIPNGYTSKLYSSMAISAIAILDGECSEVVTYEYLIGDIETVATPRIYPNGGEIEEGTEITISCDTQGATIYYSIDGSEPSIEYETAFTLTEAATVRAIAKKQYWNNSEEATASFTIKQNVVETIATPVITPDGGEVEAGAMISITCETVGVTIYYSINGSEPGRVYTGPFALTESTTVRAIAKKTGWNNSEEVTATFTVIEEDEEEDGLRTINVTLEKGILGGISRYATTFSAPYNVQLPSGVDKYIVTNTATSIITLNRSYGDVIPANQGVVLVSKYKSEIEIKEIDEEVSTAAWRKNKLMNTADGAIVAQSGFYVFGKDSKGVMKFTQAEVGSTIEANKAYLQIGGTSIRAFALGLDDDPDISGIEDVNVNDGEVEYYNLQGVKVENPEKGVYIMKQGGKTSKVVL